MLFYVNCDNDVRDGNFADVKSCCCYCCFSCCDDLPHPSITCNVTFYSWEVFLLQANRALKLLLV